MRRKEIEDLLRSEVERAKSQHKIAKAEFMRVVTDIPSQLTHSDEIQRIHNAKLDHRASREVLKVALHRFNHFMLRGKIPSDLIGP
jgi:hypothetical protein